MSKQLNQALYSAADNLRSKMDAIFASLKYELKF